MNEEERDRLRQTLEQLDRLGLFKQKGDTAIEMANNLIKELRDAEAEVHPEDPTLDLDLHARIEALKSEVREIDEGIEEIDQKLSSQFRQSR